MRLATVRDRKGLRAAVLTSCGNGGRWVAIADAARVALGDERCPDSLAGLLLRDGPDLRTPRLVVEVLAGESPPRDVQSWTTAEARFAPPVPEPGAFLDFYSFEGHVRAARARRGLDVPPEWYDHPTYYRSNQRSFVGDKDEAFFPAAETMMDYELELAAVLGAAVEGPSPAAAGAAIAGFCLLNDWSARAIQRNVMAVGLGPNKGKDFATSLGPWLVTPDEVAEAGSVELAARVNGQQWSLAGLATMRWTWGEMIAYAAEDARLEPGDVLGSGTLPGGCGLELGKFLEVGDVVELDGGATFGVLSGTVRRREERR